MTTTRTELGDFLRAARARATPPTPPASAAERLAQKPRRVKGLRREEVAARAGVSFDYYARLEQGRVGNVSDAVVRAVADVLGLDDTERRYVGTLLADRPLSAASAAPAPREQLRPSVHRILASYADAPAMVTGDGLDVLAVNDLGAALFFDPSAVPAAERNLARWVFLDPAARERHAEWDRIARGIVNTLRLQAAEGGSRAAAVIRDLRTSSEEFRASWEQPGAFECAFDAKTFRHPLVGDVTLDCEALPIPGSPHQRLHAYSAPAGSPAEAKLAVLRTAAL